MTTIISGAGLGLFNTSANLLGSAGNPLSGRPGQSNAVYVNSATGNVVIQSQDEFLASVGFDVNVIRTYNSKGTFDGDNSDNWRFNVASLIGIPTASTVPAVNKAGSTVTKRFGDGAEVIYTFDPTRSLYVATGGDGADDTLAFSSATNQWTWTDGSSRATETYSASGRLQKRTDTDGNALSFIYNASGLLTQISNAVQTLTVSNLNNRNTANPEWSIQQGLKVNDTTYGDRGYTLSAVPASVAGATWIRPAADSKSYAGNPLVSFNIDAPGDIYLAVDDRVGRLPWMDASWVDTGENLLNRESATVTSTLSLYRKSFAAGAVTLGPQANSAAATYLVIAKPAGGGRGQSIFFDYSGNNVTQLREVSQGATQTLTRYGYDASNRLTSVTVDLTPADNSITDAKIYVTRYTYDGSSKRVASITNGDGTSVSFTYDASGRVKDFTDGENKKTTLTYTSTSLSLPTAADATGLTAAQTWSVDPIRINANPVAATHGTQLKFDAAGNAVAIWPSSAFDVSAQFYDKAKETWVTLPNINRDLAPDSLDLNNLPGLSFSNNGNFFVATWVQGGRVYARRYVKGTDSQGKVTWTPGASTRLNNGQSFAAVKPQAAVNDSGRAVVTFINYDGTRNNVFASVFNGSSWQSSPTKLDDKGSTDNASAGALAPLPNVTIDASGNAFVLWMQPKPNTTAPECARFARYTASSNSWSNPDSTTLNNGLSVDVKETELAMDGTGNAVALWLQSGNLYAKSFTKSSNTWSAATTLGAATATPSLAVSANGNAIAAWVNGNDLVARRYVAGAWVGTAPEAIENLSGAATNPSASINDSGQAAIAFVQVDPSSGLRNVYVNRFSAGAWQASASVVETSATSIAATMQPVIAIDASGATEALWAQADGVYANRFFSDTAAFYLVKAADIKATDAESWAAVAQAVYGDAAAGSALKAKMPGVTLTAGLHLTGLPARLEYTATVAVNQLDVKDPLDQVTTYLSDTKGLLREVRTTASGVLLKTNYLYDARDNLIETIDGQGNRVNSLYDPNDNLLLKRDQAGNTVTYAYNSANQVTSETRFLTPDPDDNGPQPPTGALTTRYVYDAEQHPRFIVSAEGRVSESRYDAQGNLIATIRYTQAIFNQSSALALSELDLTQWLAGQDLTQSERTDFSYDFRAELSTATTYTAVNADGTGTLDGTQSVTRFIYDQRGQLLQTIDPRGEATVDSNDFVTSYTYDGLGRLLSTVQWVAAGETRTTTSVYDDAGNLVTVKLDNGLWTTSAFDKRGRLLSVTQTDVSTPSAPVALGTTTYQYDAAGQLRITTDPLGNRTHRLYDEAGRLVATVDATGALSENVYDKASNLIQTIAYANRPNATQLARLTDGSGNPTNAKLDGMDGIRPALDRLNDRVTHYLYDAANRLVLTITPGEPDPREPDPSEPTVTPGFVTRNFYDGADQVTQVTRYAASIDVAAFLALPTLPDKLASLEVPLAAENRVNRSFYDKDGYLIGTLDGEGGFCEYQYNAAGELTHTIHYAKAAAAALRATGTFEQLKADVGAPNAETPNDQRTRHFYNAKGELAATLDAEGYLTEYVYDQAGNEIETTRYYNKARTVADIDAATVDALRPDLHVNDAVTVTTYNGANEVTSVTRHGTVTRFTYNNVGQLIQTERAADTGEVRTARARYDKQGRVVRELTAEGSVELDAFMAANPGASEAEIDAVWRQWSLTHDYDRTGRLVSTTDQNGHKTLFFYDEAGRLLYTVNALGEVAALLYNSFGEVTDRTRYSKRISTADLSGGVVADELLFRIAGIAQPGGENPDSHSRNNYTLRGAVKDAIEAVDSDALRTTRSFTYNAFGEMASRVDPVIMAEGAAPVSRLTEYTYDRRGLLIKTLEDAARETITRYDAFGRVTSVSDAKSKTQGFAYDRLGRTVTLTDRVGNTHQTTYDAFSRVLTEIDALGKTVATYVYKDDERSFEVTSAEGVRLTTVMNRHGEAETFIDGNNSTTVYIYDKNGNLINAREASGNLNLDTASTYDRANRLVKTVDPNGTVTKFIYDAANRLFIRTVDPKTIDADNDNPGGLDLETIYKYDGQGRTLAVTDPEGMVTKYSYDAKGQLAQTTVDPKTIETLNDNPDGLNLITRYTYDADGRALSVTTGFGTTKAQTTTYVYDKLGRRTETRVDPTGLDLTTHYGYDDNDNLINTTDPNGEVTRYYYDANDRQVYVLDAEEGLAQRVYDANGRLVKQINYANALTHDSFPADPDQGDIEGRIPAIANPAHDVTMRYVYDDDGRLIYSVNARGEVTQTDYDGNGNAVQTTRYGIRINPNAADVVGAIRKDSNLDRVSYAVYDAANRLIYGLNNLGEVTQYDYDANGNALKTTRYANRIPIPGEVNAENVGNAVNGIKDVSADLTTYAVYDAANRLIYSVDLLVQVTPQGIVTRRMGEVTQNSFDANGNLIKSRRYGVRITLPPLLPPALDAEAVEDAITDALAQAGENVPPDMIDYAVYDTAGRLRYRFNAQGEVTQTDYDANGNAIGVTRYANRIAVPADDDLNAESVKDAIDFANAHRAVVRDEVAYAVYDAAGRQVYSFDELGEVTERRYDANGNVVKTIVYANRITIPAENERDIEHVEDAISRSHATDQVSYAVYDDTDRLIYSVDANGGVTHLLYDALGNLVQTIGYAEPILIETETLAAEDVENALGTDPTVSLRTYAVYDAAARLVYSFNALGEVTRNIYNAFGEVVTSIRYAERIEIPGTVTLGTVGAAVDLIADRARDAVMRYTYDRAGRVIATVQLDAMGLPLGATRFFYDSSGNLLMTQDPTGVRHWSLYDQAGRKVADIDGDGSLTEYIYNSSGQLIHTRSYFRAVDDLARLVNEDGEPTTPSLASMRPSQTGLDQKSWLIYDSAGRLVKTVDARGAVVETQYDAAGRVLLTKAYDKRLPSTDGLGEAPTTDAINPGGTPHADRVNYHFYDNTGRLRGSIDGEGFLTELAYNASGQVITRTRYAKALAPDWQDSIPTWNVLGATVLDSIRPRRNPEDPNDAALPDDIAEWSLYNDRGLLVGQIDGENYLTEYVYDAHGRVTETKRYARPVTVTVTAVSTLAEIRPPEDAEDRRSVTLYDITGRVFQVINAEGTVTQHTYDALGRLVRSDRALGSSDQRTSNVRYDLQGRVVGELAGKGSTRLVDGMPPAAIDAIWAEWGITHAYDAAGRRISTTDQYGNKTLFFYNVDGQLTHTVNALGEVTENKYDRDDNALGQLTDTIRYGTRLSGEVVAALTGGLITPALADALTAIADTARDSKQSFAYHTTGELASIADALGVTTSYLYNAFGEQTSTTLADSAEGRTFSETNAYDRRGYLQRTTAGTLEEAGPALDTETRHDAFGRVVSFTDSKRNVRSWTHDRLGRVVTATDAAGVVTSITSYDAFSRVLTQSDAFNNSTEYVYDRVERSVTITTPEQITVKTLHNEHGQTSQVVDGNGNTTSFIYDENGQLIETSGPLFSTFNAYDRAMRLATTTDANQTVTKLTYDAANRVLTRTVDPTTIDEENDNPQGLNLETKYEYDAKGGMLKVTDPNGIVTKFEYDLKGQLTRQTIDPKTIDEDNDNPEGLNLETQFLYDARGNTLTVVDPKGIDTTYTYDALGRRTSEARDEQTLVRYVYDRNGNVITRIDANQHLCRYVYDANDRLVFTVDQLDETFSSVKEHRYDDNGRLIKTVLYESVISLDLTDPNLAYTEAEIQVETGRDRVEHLLYDDDGRLTAAVHVNLMFDDYFQEFREFGEVTTYAYDSNGNVVERIAYATRIEIKSDSNPAGWEPGTPLPELMRDWRHDHRVRTLYDSANRAVYTLTDTTHVTVLGVSVPVMGVIAQQYDDNGNVVDRIEYANEIVRLPDVTVDNLTPLLRPDTSHDRHTVMAYDNANRLTDVFDGVGGAIQRVYDRNGNLVKLIQYATASGDDRITVMTYDNANRLVFSVDAMGGVMKQVYDRNGNVVQRIGYAERLSPPSQEGEYITEDIEATVDDNDADNRVSFAVYDFFNRQVMAMDALGGVTANRYDTAGNVIETTALAKPLDLQGVTLANVEPRLADHLNAEAAAPHNRVTKYQYDARNRLIATLDALGFVTTNEYSTAGAVTRTARYGDAIGVGTEPGDIRHALDTAINQGKIDFSKVRSTSFFYDTLGRLTSSIDAMGFSEFYSYDGVGNRISFTNKNGATWTYDYDAAGRLVTETSPEVELKTVKVDATGKLIIDDDNSGKAPVVTRFSYDALGNLVSREEAAGRPERRTTEYRYDALGRQVKTIFPAVNVYDAENDNLLTNGANGLAERREIFKTGDSRLYTEVTYDALGNAIANRDVAGNMSFKTYDKAGRVTYEIDAEAYVAFHEYNAFGEEKSLTHYAEVHTEIFDQLKQAVSDGHPQARLTDDQIDAIKNGESEGRTLLSDRDKLGRVVQVTEPTAFVYDSKRNQYFEAGKRTRTRYNAFGEVFQVAVLEAPASIAGAERWNYLTTNYYDPNGRLIEQVDALGHVTTQDYDAVGNLKQHREFAPIMIRDWDGSAAPIDPSPLPEFLDTIPARTTEYTYDLNNRRVSMIRKGIEFADETTIQPSEGTKKGNFTKKEDVTTTYGYDRVGNLVRTTVPSDDPAGASTFTYYDALGRITATALPEREGIIDALAPDPDPVLGFPDLKERRRLKPLTEFSYDALGNMVAKVDYAWGTKTADEQHYAPVLGFFNQDMFKRATYTQYDSLGHAIQTSDLASVDDNGRSHFINHYSSYNERGQLAKSWQAVTGFVDNSKRVRTAFQVFQYDKLGRLTATITPPAERYVTTSLSADFDNMTVTQHNLLTVKWRDVIDPAAGPVRVTATLNSAAGAVTVGPMLFTDIAAIADQVELRWDSVKTNSFSVFDLHIEQQVGDSWVTLYQNGAATIPPIPVAARTRYNAFGEVIEKSVTGTGAPSGHEYFHYDEAGRLWRTNSGDGVYKIMLYDLQGNMTSQIVSDGNGGFDIDLERLGGTNATASEVQEAATRLGSIRRTDNHYDGLGRVVKTVQPQRAAVAHNFSAPLSLDASTEPAGSASVLIHSVDFATGVHWNGLNRITVDLSVIALGGASGRIALLGSGEIKAVVDYQTLAYTVPQWGGESGGADQPPAPGGGPFTVPSVLKSVTTNLVPIEQQQSQTLQLAWSDPDSSDVAEDRSIIADKSILAGGVSRINRIKLYKKDVQGKWKPLAELSPDGQQLAARPALYLPAPNDGGEVRVSIARAGVSAAALTPINLGEVLYYDLSALADGLYDYRIEVFSPDGVLNRVAGLGFISVAGNEVSVTAASSDAPQNPRPVMDKTYDRWGNMLSISDPRAVDWITQFTYNADDQITQIILPAQKVSDVAFKVLPITTLLYDKLGRQFGTVENSRYHFDPGLTTFVYDHNINWKRYDALGNVVEEHRADGGVVRHVYNFFGEKVETEDAMGRRTYFQYDAMGRLTKIKRPPVTQGERGFDGSQFPGGYPGNTLAPAIETFAYDEMGNTILQTDGDDRATLYRYDLRGNIVLTLPPRPNVGTLYTKTAYDAHGRKVLEEDGNGNTATWTYDYFGRLIGHTDIGNADYDYRYDHAGQLVRQTNTRHQDIAYQYDVAGQLKSISNVVEFDTASSTPSVTQTINYAYDLAGHRVLERTTLSDNRVLQNNHMRYDAQGRMTEVADTRVDIQIDYDLLGNRRHIHHALEVTTPDTKGVVATHAVSEDRFFLYDKMNRQIVVDAVADTSDLPNVHDTSALESLLGRHRGRYLTYDLNGNRTSDTHWAEKRIVAENENGAIDNFDEFGRPLFHNTTYNDIGAGFARDVYGYDARDRLQSVLLQAIPVDLPDGSGADPRAGLLLDYRKYSAAGLLLRTGPTLANSGDYADKAGGKNGIVDGIESRENTYDAAGRLSLQIVFDSREEMKYRINYGEIAITNPVVSSPYYDGAGNLDHYNVTVFNENGDPSYTVFYGYDYSRFEGYRVKTISGDSDPLIPGSTLHVYDVSGNLIRTQDTRMPDNDRKIENDLSGRPLYEEQTTHVDSVDFLGNGIKIPVVQSQRQLMVNGEWMGRYGMAIDEAAPRNKDSQKPNFKLITDFNFGFQPIAMNYPSAAPGGYTVRAGDTLQAIAHGAYGDASLWYIIADANGLSGAEPLTPGRILSIPNRVGTVHNNYTSYKPYDPSKIPGDTTPFLPPAQRGTDGCSGWGYILVIVVAAVVAVALSAVTYGAATALLGPSILAAIAAGTAAGAVGSIASQVITLGLDPSKSILKDFKWGAVGKAAIIGGISAGLLRTLDVGVLGDSLAGSTLKRGISNTGASFGSRVGQTAVFGLGRAAASFAANVIGQGVAVKLGWQKEWSWAEATAAAVSSGVGAMASRGVDRLLSGMPPGFAKDVLVNASANFAGSVAGKYSSMKFFNKGKLEWAEIAADAFSNALGNAIGGRNALTRKQDRDYQEQRRTPGPEPRTAFQTSRFGGYSSGELAPVLGPDDVPPPSPNADGTINLADLIEYVDRLNAVRAGEASGELAADSGFPSVDLPKSNNGPIVVIPLDEYEPTTYGPPAPNSLNPGGPNITPKADDADLENILQPSPALVDHDAAGQSAPPEPVPTSQSTIPPGENHPWYVRPIPTLPLEKIPGFGAWVRDWNTYHENVANKNRIDILRMMEASKKFLPKGLPQYHREPLVDEVNRRFYDVRTGHWRPFEDPYESDAGKRLHRNELENANDLDEQAEIEEIAQKSVKKGIGILTRTTGHKENGKWIDSRSGSMVSPASKPLSGSPTDAKNIDKTKESNSFKTLLIAENNTDLVKPVINGIRLVDPLISPRHNGRFRNDDGSELRVFLGADYDYYRTIRYRNRLLSSTNPLTDGVKPPDTLDIFGEYYLRGALTLFNWNNIGAPNDPIFDQSNFTISVLSTELLNETGVRAAFGYAQSTSDLETTLLKFHYDLKSKPIDVLGLFNFNFTWGLDVNIGSFGKQQGFGLVQTGQGYSMMTEAGQSMGIGSRSSFNLTVDTKPAEAAIQKGATYVETDLKEKFQNMWINVRSSLPPFMGY